MTTADRLRDVLGDRYRIERELGAGGMATVYLAEDIKHHRKVAIKVLHPELSAVLGPDRFLKEIELTANLQHPHILPLFDSGSADGLLYYVMPYVEGETLRGLLTRERQVAIPFAIRIATEVADALEYAHRRKVIHRDIKPENILLHDGRALVADFGIALAVQQAGGERMTQTGMSLGTPQYMAPEQAMGDKAVDHRADIYALGAVTYEMLAGEPPFTGPTSQAIVARVITEKPRPLRELRDTVPRNVASAVNAALQKLPADRPATAAEFSGALTAGAAERHPEEPESRSIDKRLAALAAVALLIVGAAAGYAVGGRSAGTADSSAVPSRLSILAPTVGGTGPAGLNRQIALTPDGSAVVYVALSALGQNNLAYQRLDASEPVVLAKTDGILNPVVSPDGRSIAGGGGSLFGNRIAGRKVSIANGTLTDMPTGLRFNQADWTPDGTIWFERGGNGTLAALQPDGKIVQKSRVKAGLSLQQMLSDGRSALMVRSPSGTASGPALIVNVETGAESPLIEIPIVEVRHTAGHLVYVQPTGTMWAVPFDEKGRRITGVPVQIASSVSVTGTGQAQFAVAQNGTVAFIPEEPRSLVFADRQGRFQLATAELRNFHAPVFAPDGKRISIDFTGTDGRDVWILSLGQGTLFRATFDRDGHDATWTPDGQSITYSTFRNNSTFGLYRVRPGSGAKPDSLLVSPKMGYTGHWLPDGSGLVTTSDDLSSGSGRDVALVSNGGRGPLVPLVSTPFQEQYASVSRDGKWLAFVSDQSGADQVYVRPLKGDGDVVQVSQNGGSEPVWASNGRELFYRGGSEGAIDLMSASVGASAGFEITSRQKLFPLADIVAANPHANYDVSPDGRTFVMVRRSPSMRITILQNLPQLVARIRDQATPRN